MMQKEIISAMLVFKICLTFNLISVIYNSITDCDETYNYWEPLHFLMFGKGFQTWEYSQQYGLRSYFFLFIYGWPSILLKYVFPFVYKYVFFYIIRIYLALVLSYLEKKLFENLKNALKNEFTAFYSVMFFVFSAGSFISATAFLPSSFAMFCSMYAISSWLKGDYNKVILSIACSSIIGWPFAAAIGIPFAIDITFRQCGIIYFIKTSLLWGIFFTTLSVLCDSFFYGSLTFPSLNIVKYNVFNSHGSELYGIETFHYYIKNFILNFNICVALCFFLLIIVIFNLISNFSLLYKLKIEIIILSVMIVWNVIFFIQPHKEERFLFPCYPFLAIACGMCLQKILNFFDFFFNIIKQKFLFGKYFKTEYYGFMVLIIYGLINMSRIFSIIFSFNSSHLIYHQLNELQLSEEKVLCLGREWHRFPSNFFLTSPFLHISFIKSDFKGQLPAKYLSSENIYATKVYHKHFNDLNKEETSRYVHLSKCNYIIDRVDSTSVSVNEPNWESLISSHWQRISTMRIINPKNVGSKMTLFRSFYIPFIFETMNDFVDYVLLEKV